MRILVFLWYALNGISPLKRKIKFQIRPQNLFFKGETHQKGGFPSTKYNPLEADQRQKHYFPRLQIKQFTPLSENPRPTDGNSQTEAGKTMERQAKALTFEEYNPRG